MPTTTTLNGLLRGLFSVLLLLFVITSQAAENGLLWKIEAADGRASHLFGTMHSDDPRINDFSPKLKQALADSDVFMMETLPPSDIGIYFMQDATMRDLLSAQEVAQVLKLADFHSMHEDAALRMKPWLLAMIFDLPKPQGPYAQDVQLMSMAQSQGKPLLGLEDTAEHFATLDSLSREEHLVMLRAVLKRTPEQKSRDFEQLLKAYMSGDIASIGMLNEKITGGMLPTAFWKKMRVKLLDERNTRMAQRIMQEAAGRSVFVAVGASHLPGENGLLNQLRAAGYRVSRVE